MLVDGDHSRAGVRQDLLDLLGSPAISRTVIVMHDTFNGEVRAGITDVDFASNPAVAFVELDLTGGYMARTGPFAGQLWGGLGLAVVDAEVERRPGIYNRYLHDAYGMIRELGGDPDRGSAPRPGPLSRAATMASLSAELARTPVETPPQPLAIEVRDLHKTFRIPVSASRP